MNTLKISNYVAIKKFSWRTLVQGGGGGLPQRVQVCMEEGGLKNWYFWAYILYGCSLMQNLKKIKPQSHKNFFPPWGHIVPRFWFFEPCEKLTWAEGP